jgi:uncharacterized protein with von Willebrand factor type A (vWA) domain
MLLGDARSGKFAVNVLGFARTLRRAGLSIDAQRIVMAQRALEIVGPARRDDVCAALEATLVSRIEDRPVFLELFAAFFRDPELARQLMAQLLPSSKAAAKPSARSPRAAEALVPPRAGLVSSAQSHQEMRLDAAMTASDRQRLRYADFQSLSASEFQLMERLVRDVPFTLPRVPTRRRVSSSRGALLDWHRMLRDCGRYGGEMVPTRRRSALLRPLPLVMLVDVSGSMERYARLLLSFLHRATRGMRRQPFAIGTDLTDLGPAFREDNPDRMLEVANRRIPDFAGGTRLGTALRRLRQAHPQALVGRRSMVLLITDGLDTGDPHELERELAWLAHQSRCMVWLNPLLRFDGYQPLARGAGAISRYADRSLAIHNLSRLEDLATGLARVVRL